MKPVNVWSALSKTIKLKKTTDINEWISEKFGKLSRILETFNQGKYKTFEFLAQLNISYDISPISFYRIGYNLLLLQLKIQDEVSKLYNVYKRDKWTPQSWNLMRKVYYRMLL